MSDTAIILVTRNARAFVGSAVAQLRTQRSGTGAVIYAIDGHSDDGTWDLLPQSEVGWTVERQEGTGLAGARNQGLRMSAESFVAFLDADDVWEEDKLIRQRRFLDANASADVAICHLQKLRDGRMVGATMPAWTPSGCLFRRRAFDIAGEFDPQYAIGCDHEWFIRAGRAGVTMGLMAECLMAKHLHEGNLSNQRAVYRREVFRMLRSASNDR